MPSHAVIAVINVASQFEYSSMNLELIRSEEMPGDVAERRACRPMTAVTARDSMLSALFDDHDRGARTARDSVTAFRRGFRTRGRVCSFFLIILCAREKV